MLSVATMIASTALPAIVSAFEELKPAQKLIYDHDHLRKTEANQVLQYNFSLAGKDIEAIEDVVQVTIKNKVDEELRDVSIEFLSDDKNMFLPDFDAYRGNPVIIAMLEYSARYVGEASGGGTLYFRNRIRDQMAADIGVQTAQSSFNGTSIATNTISFKPFEGDANLVSMSLEQFENMVYTITLSDDVTGGVAEITIESKDDSGTVILTNALTFNGVKTP